MFPELVADKTAYMPSRCHSLTDTSRLFVRRLRLADSGRAKHYSRGQRYPLTTCIEEDYEKLAEDDTSLSGEIYDVPQPNADD